MLTRDLISHAPSVMRRAWRLYAALPRGRLDGFASAATHLEPPA